jgi:hypothetical protein
MKFQLKTLVAAVALVAAAGSAFAAPMALNTTATGSSLLFYAFDDATKTSYVQDLGQTFSSFLSTSAAATTFPGFTTSVSTNTAWNDYLTSVAGDTSNTYWGVISGLSANAGNAGNGFMSTIREGESADGQTAATGKGTVIGPLRNVLIGVNGATDAASTGYFSASAAGDNIANNFGHNGAGKLVFNTDNLIGATSAFQYGNNNAAFALTTYANADGNSTFSFDGNNVSYAVAVAAVPEPETYAMMLAGLMLVGGIAARRRKSAK